MVRIFLALVTTTSFLSLANAAPAERNCFNKDGARFFAGQLEDIAAEGSTPVLLLNDADQVVGVISVKAERAEKYPHAASRVVVGQVSICSSIQVSDFYYPDEAAENLLNWATAPNGTVSVTQDEGMIVINAKISKTSSEVTRIDAEFRAYDVFENDEPTNAQKKNPGYLQDWGLPKGSGSFHFFLPNNWKN